MSLPGTCPGCTAKFSGAAFPLVDDDLCALCMAQVMRQERRVDAERVGMRPIARIASYTGNIVHLQGHRPEIVRVGDVFATSWIGYGGGEDVPLRRGRVQVSGIREDGAFIVSPDLASAIPAVCAGEFGDWLYRVGVDEGQGASRGATETITASGPPVYRSGSLCDHCPLCGAPTTPPVSLAGMLVLACPCVS